MRHELNVSAPNPEVVDLAWMGFRPIPINLSYVDTSIIVLTLDQGRKTMGMRKSIWNAATIHKLLLYEDFWMYAGIESRFNVVHLVIHVYISNNRSPCKYEQSICLHHARLVFHFPRVAKKLL